MQERSLTLSKPAVSNRKREANKRNAQKSTGPRTSRGKENSSRNSFRHGFFSHHLFAESQIPTEDLSDYRKLHERLVQELEPVGILEEQTVEEIAVCYWKKRNLLRYENAKREWDFHKLAVPVYKGRMRSKVRLLNHQALCILERGQEAVEATGKLPDNFKQELFQARPDLEETWHRLVQVSERELPELAEGENAPKLAEELGFSLEDFEEGRVSPELVHERAGKFIFKFLLMALKMYVDREGDESEKRFLNLAVGYTAIPIRKSLKSCLRYGAAVRKEFNGLLEQLERLQARRLKNCPPD